MSDKNLQEWTAKWLIALFRSDQPDVGVLKGLDQINWSALTHAYGQAEDVPSLLRALLSQDKDHREFACQLLHETIWHQGDICQASAYTVPFLYAMLEASETPDKALVAFLIASLADGQPSWERILADKEREAEWRIILARSGESLEARVIKERAEIKATRDAIRERLPLLYPYLEHEEPAVRGHIAKALGYYPERVQEFLPILEKMLVSETDQFTIEDIQEAIARVKENC
ncbi:MAG: HEAT repeat domain-containing protein [Acidobacteriota bacterium]